MMEKRMNVTNITIAMAAYPNVRVAAIVISVLYRMLTKQHDTFEMSSVLRCLIQFSYINILQSSSTFKIKWNDTIHYSI